MKKNEYHVIGVMSGTSLDGVDIADLYFTVSETNQWNFSIKSATTVPYTAAWKKKLKEAVHNTHSRLLDLNEEYTRYLGEMIFKFIKTHSLQGLDAVCSHGHTILHQPEKGITLQIGNLPDLALYVQQTVVCDFRVQDVILEGQGAPLVPIGDQLLFNNYDYCMNVGGFANISFEKDGKRRAYDICPVNIVLNRYAEKLGKPFDENGKTAASGKINTNLLAQLNDLAFYASPPPKSLGLEWVQQNILPLLEASGETTENILSTFTKHCAVQIAAQLQPEASVLLTGGGAYNKHLIARISAHKKVKITLPEPLFIEYKEALIFGLLGVLKLRGEVNCLASVTGAKRDHSAGHVFHLNAFL